MNDPWVHRLSDYIDGELAAEDVQELERHLAQCEHCQVVLDDLRKILARAGELEDHYPNRDLWAGIAGAIGAEAVPAVDADPNEEMDGPATETVVSIDTLAERRRTLSLSVPQLLAACLALMILSGGAGWLLRSPGGPDRAVPELTELADATDPTERTDSAELTDLAARTDPGATLDPGQDATPRDRRGPEEMQTASVPPRQESKPTLAEAMVGLDKRIAELHAAFVEYGETLDSETLAVLQDNLYFLDRAIFEAREALQEEPESEYLNAHLADSMMRKVRFLQRAADIAAVEI